MTADTRRKDFLWIVLASALFLRVYHLNLPFLEPYNNITRQAVSGMIVRNFYLHGFNFFYPQIDQGPGPYLFNAEMPLCTYLMALMYRLTGGVHEWSARLVSVLFSMGTLIFLYGLLKRLYDERLALLALIFAAFSPMSVALSRSIQPDIAALFGSMGAVTMLYEYFFTRKRRFFALSAFFFFFAISSKVYALYLALPLLAITRQFDGPRLLRDRKNYIYAAVSLAALGWYVFMWHEGRIQHLYYDTINYNRGPSFDHVWELFSTGYLFRFSKVFFVHILTVPGTLLFIAGFAPSRSDKYERFFYVWLAAILLLLVLFWRISIEHSYYQLPFVLPASFFVARGIERITGHPVWKALPGRGILAIFFCLSAAANALYFYKGLYSVPERVQVVLRAAQAIQPMVPRDSLLIASFGASPALLYYCDRKGWEFDIQNSDETRLVRDFENLRKQGAGFFVCADLPALKNKPGFERYLRERFTSLGQTPDFVIFRL